MGEIEGNYIKCLNCDECDSEFLIDDNWGSNICPDCLDKKELVRWY